MMLPLLRVLDAAGKEMHHSEYDAAVAELMGLTDEQRHSTLPSGGSALRNRTGWASWTLQQARLVERVRPGHARITEEGRKLLAKNPAFIDVKFLTANYPTFAEKMAQSSSSNANSNTVEATPSTAQTEEQTPDELIDRSEKKLRQTLAADLQDFMAKMNPYKFEKLVVDLLFAMGYGGSREEAAQVTKKSNDEGIDGVINEDRLGLDVIYVQAKRWQSNVGRQEIQNFVGALAGKHAHKGVFITTSGFNSNAIEYVKTVQHHKIVLVDGQRLAELMIEHNIAVSTVRTVAIKQVDSDYFEE